MAKTTPKNRIGKNGRKGKTRNDQLNWAATDARMLQIEIGIEHINSNLAVLTKYLAESRSTAAKDLLLELYETVRQTGMDAYGEDLEPAPGTVMARVKEYLFGKASMENVRGPHRTGEPGAGPQPLPHTTGGEADREGKDPAR